MPTYSTILSQLPPYSGRKLIYQKNQGVSDVIAGITATHNQYRSQYNAIASQFADSNPVKVCSNLWHFLKKNCHYVIEPDSFQTLRSPSAILHLGKNPNVGLDCKSYSLFIGGCLDALNRMGYNIPWCYRFASYRWYDPMPHHVFVVAYPNTDREIWIDPVLSSFNQKKKYFYKTDKKMALIGISGVNRRQSRQQRRAANKLLPKKQRLKAALKKRGKLFVKFNPATVSARNSFLLLVKLNVFNLAKRLNALIKKDESKLRKFWEKIGGNYNNLLRNIRQGAARKHGKAIGFAPAIAAAIASATPVVIKVVDVLKKAGISSDDLANVAKKVISKVVKTKLDSSESPEGQMSSNIENEGEVSTSAADSMEQTAENIEEATEDNMPADEGVGNINFRNALPFVAIAAGIFFLTRKK